MKIVHVTSIATSGLGIEKEAMNLAIAQKGRGYDVMVVIDRPGKFTESFREQEISVVVNDGLSRREDGLATTETRARESTVHDFIESIEDFSPDIIHCHDVDAALVGIAAGNRVNIPCVFTIDGPFAAIEGNRRGLRFSVICITAASFERLKKDVPEMDVYYIPNGTRVLPQVQARQTGIAGSVSLISAGHLIDRKGIDTAILAMVELRRRLGRRCPVLNIYGDGPKAESLAEMATVLELNQIVRFHGFKSAILEHCPSTDILILSSHWEASPLVVLEAMSRGMPIVATDVGDVTRMIPDRRYGRVVRPGSAVALAEAIESLLAEIADGQFNSDLLIERHRSLYSFEKWTERMEAAYNQVLM